VIKAIIFDFDGLMVDTETPAYESWLEIYREHGCEFPFHLWARVLGSGGDEFDPCAYLEQQAGYALDRAAILDRRWQRKQALGEGQPLLPGVEEYVAAAQQLGLKLGVASSSSRRWVTGHLDRLTMSRFFDVIITAADVTRVKPDPEIYHTAVQALGVAPEHAIAIEDSPNGVRAAKGAGLFCIAVPNALTGKLPLDHADLRLTSLAEMPVEALLALTEGQVSRHSVAWTE
jgi:HAD superfamily hydrolase (TIGR01509 family)